MTRVVVLIKDFGEAKQRLGPALSAERRRRLAATCAERALVAAGPDAIVVAGGQEVADLARRHAGEVVVEERPSGQRAAAMAGIGRALELGAEAVLLLSSDLPAVTAADVEAMLAAGATLAEPAALAAPASGRGGTNALYLRPPDALGMHFGDDSLAAFEADARTRGVRFERFSSPALALDLDEPEDLVAAGALIAPE